MRGRGDGRPWRRVLPLLAAVGALAACDSQPPATETPAGGASTNTAALPDTGRIFERSVVFVGTGSDSVFVVPWLWTVRTGGAEVERRARGWLLRGSVWDPFFDESGDFRGYRGTARDVTEQRRAVQALSEAHAKLEAMTTSGLIGITNGRGYFIEDANDAFLEMLGRDRSMLRGGLDWRQLVPPDSVSEEVKAADGRRTTGDSYTTETAYRHADGHYVPVLLNVVVLDGEERRWFALIQDLTPMKLAEARIRELAERDPLTGLANRHVLFERLAGDLGERRTPGTGGALMLLDLVTNRPRSEG